MKQGVHRVWPLISLLILNLNVVFRSDQGQRRGEARSETSLQAGAGADPSILPKLVKDSRKHFSQLIHGGVHVPVEKPCRGS